MRRTGTPSARSAVALVGVITVAALAAATNSRTGPCPRAPTVGTDESWGPVTAGLRASLGIDGSTYSTGAPITFRRRLDNALDRPARYYPFEILNGLSRFHWSVDRSTKKRHWGDGRCGSVQPLVLLPRTSVEERLLLSVDIFSPGPGRVEVWLETTTPDGLHVYSNSVHFDVIP